MSLARKKFTEFKECSDRIADAELDDFWATLQPATIADMIGEWKGGEFLTGHMMNGQLEKAGWFGKSFARLLQEDRRRRRDGHHERQGRTG
jgi:GXWXG protein